MWFPPVASFPPGSPVLIRPPPPPRARPVRRRFPHKHVPFHSARPTCFAQRSPQARTGGEFRKKENRKSDPSGTVGRSSKRWRRPPVDPRRLKNSASRLCRRGRAVAAIPVRSRSLPAPPASNNPSTSESRRCRGHQRFVKVAVLTPQRRHQCDRAGAGCPMKRSTSSISPTVRPGRWR